MKNLLLICLLILVSCGQEKSSQNESELSDDSHAASQNKLQAEPSPELTVKISKEYVTGQFDFKTHDEFVKVDPQYSDKEIYLHNETYRAFSEMADSAKADGITLTIISGTRNFNYQKSIWDRKWNASNASSDSAKARGILEYSSMPMTSRHHWGTDIDLNDLNNSYFESGQGKKEYEWLKANANGFGFYQPYTDKSLTGRTGYNEEKWHWSYMPLANQYLAFYNQHVTDSDITGFKGAELATKIEMVKNYVNGVSMKIKEYKGEK